MNLVKFQATHGIVSNAPQTIMIVADDPVLIPRLFHGAGEPSNTTLNAGNGRYNAAGSGFIIAATLLDPGSGYAANDVLTLLTGTASQTLQITVDEVDSAGAILNYHVSRCGIYSVYPDLFPGCTGGTGSGAAFTPSLPPADQYLDETDPDNPALYVCQTAGTAATSVWKKISGGGGNGKAPVPYLFVDDGGDYWVAQVWNHSAIGAPQQFIHKPWKLRAGGGAIGSETFGGVTYTYTYSHNYFSGTSGAGYYTKAISGSDGSSGTYYPIPLLFANDVILAQEVTEYDDAAHLHRTVYSIEIWTSGGGGGTGYTAGDVLSVSGGTGTAAQITVDTVDGSGVILTAHLSAIGDYTTTPSLINPVTGGTGSGAEFVLTLAPILIDLNNDGRAWSR